MDIKLPLITGRTVQEQVQQIISYLVRLARQLQQLPESETVQVQAATQEEQSRSSFHRLQVTEDLQVGGSLMVAKQLQAQNVNGVYLYPVRVWGSDSFSVYTGLRSWGPGRRQTFLVSGSMNGTPVMGVARASSDGSVYWSGTEGVSLTFGEDGSIRVKLANTAYDYFLVLSPEEFTV